MPQRQPATEAAVAGGGLDLEGALQASGQAPADDEHAELFGIGEGARSRLRYRAARRTRS